MSTKLFIDMDGTTCRFHDEVQYLERMFEEGFFRNLKPFDEAVLGLKRFSEQNPDVEIYILSTTINGEPPYCKAEKNEWLDEHLPFIDSEHRLFVPQGESKAAFAYTHSGANRDDLMILYDDYNKTSESGNHGTATLSQLSVLTTLTIRDLEPMFARNVTCGRVSE